MSPRLPNMATTDMSLLSTFQKHIEDMRNLSLCKICIKPFYEPFILPCGHTYCYSCLASWFGGSQSRKRKKNCPDCRAEVKVQPSPNYLLRDLVHMFISRAELLPEDETVQEHQQAKEDEAVMLAADRTGAGLFKGAFVQHRHLNTFRERWRLGLQGIMDHEDGVIRCPECHWELEDGQCLQCGFLQYEPGDSDSDSEEDSVGSQSIHTADTDFDADGDEIDQEFGSSMDLRYYEPYEDFPSQSDGTRSDHGDYDERYDLDDFLDDDDDGDSVSTMTMYHRDRRAALSPGPFGPVPGSDSESSEPDPGSDAHSTTHGETSDANTNYDEVSEASDARPQLIISRPIRRPMIIVSDDSEEDTQESSGGEGGSEEATVVSHGEENVDAESSVVSQDGLENGDSGSEDSDIRPPQPSALRRQRLQGQRARRSNHSYQPHTRAPRIHNSLSQERHGRQQTNGRPRTGVPQYRSSGGNDSHRRNSHSRSDGHPLRGW